MTDVQRAIDYVRQNRERFLAELKSFVAIPSILTILSPGWMPAR